MCIPSYCRVLMFHIILQLLRNITLETMRLGHNATKLHEEVSSQVIENLKYEKFRVQGKRANERNMRTLTKYWKTFRPRYSAAAVICLFLLLLSLFVVCFVFFSCSFLCYLLMVMYIWRKWVHAYCVRVYVYNLYQSSIVNIVQY